MNISNQENENPLNTLAGLLFIAVVMCLLGTMFINMANGVLSDIWREAILSSPWLGYAGLALLVAHRLMNFKSPVLVWFTPLLLFCTCMQFRVTGGLLYWVIVVCWMFSILMFDRHYGMGLWYKPEKPESEPSTAPTTN